MHVQDTRSSGYGALTVKSLLLPALGKRTKLIALRRGKVLNNNNNSRGHHGRKVERAIGGWRPHPGDVTVVQSTHCMYTLHHDVIHAACE